MVSVILMQQKDKAHKIGLVEKSMKEHPDLDLKDFVLEICNMFLCCERKAKEYIKIAQWRIANENI